MNALAQETLFGDPFDHCHAFHVGLDASFYWCLCGKTLSKEQYEALQNMVQAYWQRVDGQRRNYEASVGMLTKS